MSPIEEEIKKILGLGEVLEKVELEEVEEQEIEEEIKVDIDELKLE